MYWISVSALGSLWYFYCKGRKKINPNEHETFVTLAPGAAETAGTEQDTSADPEPADTPEPHQSLAALKQATDHLERHTLYSRAIDAAYRKRNTDPAMRTLVIEYGNSYVKEFPKLKPVVFKQFKDDPKILGIFKQLAIVLEEDKAYERAMDICRTAINHELEDGTKTGYEGRLGRLMKKKGTAV